MSATALVAILGNVFAGGLYAERADEGATYPYAVYTLVDAVPANTFDGSTGLENSRWQVDVFALDPATRDAAAAAAMAAMQTAGNLTLSRTDQFEDDAQLFRAILDFSMWNN